MPNSSAESNSLETNLIIASRRGQELHHLMIDSLALDVEQRIAETEAFIEQLPDYPPRAEKKRANRDLLNMREIANGG